VLHKNGCYYVSSYRVYAQPPEAPAPARMGFPNLFGEWRIARESLRLSLALPRFALMPGGQGQPVVLVPGFKAPEASMQPLRGLLRAKGYNAVHWGEGTNQGDVEFYLERMKLRLNSLSLEYDSPVAVIGWSLGGVIARELARDCPALVSTVVTYGSPVIGGPVHTAAARAYTEDERERIESLTRERSRETPISTPLAVIFSRRDSIVSWPACIDRSSLQATHYEVTSTHFSMGIDPAVWQIVLERLAKT
jgi:pimeloyl-ACP methyl ester carboxylesterase